jgi:molybdopterin-binding protein
LRASGEPDQIGHRRNREAKRGVAVDLLWFDFFDRALQSSYVLIRASSVILSTDNLSGFMLSARNLLIGTIKRLHTDSVNTEVVIALKGQDTLVAIVTSDAAKELELTVGKTVNAIFKATDVIVGVQR